MALAPADRYPTALDLTNDVQHWLADESMTAYRQPWSDRVARWARRHRPWAMAGAASLLVVTVVAAVAALLVKRARWYEPFPRSLAEQRLDELQAGLALRYMEELDPARAMLADAEILNARAVPPTQAEERRARIANRWRALSGLVRLWNDGAPIVAGEFSQNGK